MKTIIIKFLILLFLVLMLPQNSGAQSKESLLKKLEKIEKILDKYLQDADKSSQILTTTKSDLKETSIALKKVTATAAPEEVSDLTAKISELGTIIKELESRILALEGVSGEVEGSQEEAEEEGEPLAFLGFFDVNIADLSTMENPWAIGPFEFDVEYTHGERYSGAGAFVFEDGVAEVGVAFIEMHSTNSNVITRGRIFDEPGYHVQVGLFDVPFGIDFQYYATPDRETISAPLTTEFIMDGGWGDAGARVYGSRGYIDYTLFNVNGFNDGYNWGGRIGFSPFYNPYSITLDNYRYSWLKIGVSYSADITAGNKNETIMAFDLDSIVGPFELRSEYIKRENLLNDVELSGYYILGKYQFESMPIFINVNYDMFTTESDIEVKRMLYSFTYEISENASFKMEYLDYLDNNYLEFDEEIKDNILSMKLVISF